MDMDRGMNMIEEMLKRAEKSSLETGSKKQIQVRIRECCHSSTHLTQLQEEIQIDEKPDQNFISHIMIPLNCEVKSRSEKIGGANQDRIKQRTSSRVPPPSFSFLPTPPAGAPRRPGRPYSSRMCHHLRSMERVRERQADSLKP
jgi:hypothetical protein